MKKRILIAPLNWGLGHATRCIPIINALIENNFEPLIASDGTALLFLKKEFPQLKHIALPSYNIEYSEKGRSTKLKLLKELPRFLKIIKEENNAVKKIIYRYKINGIISDNRFGVYNNKIPSVYITHQLNVLSGNTTWISTKFHQNVIKKFNECWVLDNERGYKLSGRLGHLNNPGFKTKLKYLGVLSRFNKQELNPIFDLLVLLSGPEPQRTLLEKKLITELQHFSGMVLFVKGIVEKEQSIIKKNQITFYNFMQSDELEKAINQSKLIISRSGYTTIMDLSKLEKKAFFIPTPGQFEQEYLASHLKNLKLAPYCKQDEFTLEKLKETNNYNGLKNVASIVNYKDLFCLFESERKLATNT